MNNLFENFDLTPSKREQAKTLVTKVKNPKKTLTKKVTTEKLFSNEDFNINIGASNVESLIKKINSSSVTSEDSHDVKKALKSAKIPLLDKLALIKANVLRVLGKQRVNTILIKDNESFEDYINKAIASGRIDIDTETNNSTDPITCQIMGLCLYYPGGKRAYIPINHVNPMTDERLEWQLTEEDCGRQLKRLLDANAFTIMHNGKFDYEVMYCTCGVKVAPKWDTIVAARLINENEEAGLKKQYINKIDKSQEKYDIDSLFTIPYKYVDPEIFALYAATDAYMTDKLYEIQKAFFDDPKNSKLYNVFMTIEMPIVVVTAEMELTGVSIDTDFGEKLKIKYENELVKIDEKISKDFEKLQPIINEWSKLPENSEASKQFEPKKSKKSREEIEAQYPYLDKKTGKRFKYGKAKKDQLDNPINLSSPLQLAILFYDILKCDNGNKNNPRGTGKEELKAIVDKYPDLTICKLLLERRGVMKLISTYIEPIPALAKHWPDGRMRVLLNSLGTDTGRYSSGGSFYWLDGDTPIATSSVNIQNIPSHEKEIRMLFKASINEKTLNVEDNEDFTVNEFTEVETTEGWRYCRDLKVGDILIGEDDNEQLVTNICYDEVNRQYEISTSNK